MLIVFITGLKGGGCNPPPPPPWIRHCQEGETEPDAHSRIFKSIAVGPFYIGICFEPIWTLLPEDVARWAVLNPTGYRTL